MRISILAGLLLGLLGGGLSLHAQSQNLGLDFRAEVGGAAAAGGELPFWLVANQSGRLDPLGANSYAWLSAHRAFDESGWWDIGFGADLVARGSEASSVYLNELYAAARLGFLKVRLGRQVETLGTVDEVLSMGSLATSTNATPSPKLVIQTMGYTPVPFTKGYAEFKGYFSHGWFWEDRYVEDAYLHQLHAHVKLGGSLPVNAYAGILHDAFWAGTSPDHRRLPSSLEDYFRIILGMSGGEESIDPERIYVQGNHLGIYDAGITAQVREFELLAYRHFLFDDKDGLKLENPQDGLLGISIRDLRADRWVDRLTYEYLYSKWQGGPLPPGSGRGGHGGQDNYYNHYIYRSGWAYYGRTIGSPLMFPYPDGEIRHHDRIENNRIVAHHVGVAGQPVSGMRYRLLATYSRNYGTYTERKRVNQGGGTYRYQNGLTQYSFLLETQVQLPSRYPLELLAALALDVGEVYNDTLGLRLGLIYHGRR